MGGWVGGWVGGWAGGCGWAGGRAGGWVGGGVLATLVSLSLCVLLTLCNHQTLNPTPGVKARPSGLGLGFRELKFKG